MTVAEKKRYTPLPNTRAAQAIEFIEKACDRRPKGAWVPNIEVCTALGVPPNAIRPSLDKAIEVGLVEKSICPNGFTQWRMGVIKPRRVPRKTAPETSRRYSIDWPPGFVSRFDSVEVSSFETRRK